MNIRDMIPGLDTEALKTMRINASRLAASGTPKQKDQARDALLLIDEEEARRRAAEPPAAPKTRKKASTAGAGETRGKGRTTNDES